MDKTSTRGRKRKSRSVGRPRKNGNASNNNPVEEILKAAAALFSFKGYAGTTMAEIADEVGIRGPSLYYHFKSKADILRALSDHGLGGAVEITDRLRLETSLTPAARLHLLMQGVIAHIHTSEYDLNCLFDPVLQDEEFQDINKELTAWMKVLEGFVVDGVKNGELNVEKTETTAYLLRGIVISSVRDLAQFKLSPEELAIFLADFALTAMLGEKTTLKSIHKELAVLNQAA